MDGAKIFFTHVQGQNFFLPKPGPEFFFKKKPAPPPPWESNGRSLRNAPLKIQLGELHFVHLWLFEVSQ